MLNRRLAVRIEAERSCRCAVVDLMHFDPSAALRRAAGPLTLALDAAATQRIVGAQLRAVWQHSSLGIVLASAFAVVLAVHLNAVLMPAAPVRGWIVCKLAIAALRLLQARAYFRAGDDAGPAWRPATFALLAIDGAVWGAAGCWIALAQPITEVSLAIAALAGVSCAATFGLQISVLATAAYVVPILVPMLTGLLLRGDDFGAVGAIGLALLAGLQLATAARTQRRWIDSELLRLQAQQLARAKDEALGLALRQGSAKSQFIANLSHELRTPLHGILGIARLLQLDAAAGEAQDHVAQIEASGRHLLGLINDLLDVSRIDAGQFTIRPQPFELVAQLAQVADLYAVRAREKGLVFTTQINIAAPCWVAGDAGRFRQVLHNLLGNALKFTEAGSIALHAGRDGAAAERFCIEVSDSGCGIAAADLPHLFDAFAQFSAGSNEPLPGTGLGLTIAREIACAMGGDIVVESRSGRGSRFVFTARFAAAQAPAPAPPRPAPAARVLRLNDRQAAPALHGWVLVVDDDDVNAMIVAAYLERFGIATERAHDGLEAVGRALRPGDRPALVLMDRQMPLMDGLAATQAIREREAALGLAPVAVIAMTATSTDADRAACLASGMDGFLAKPFSAEQLFQVMRRQGDAGAGEALS